MAPRIAMRELEHRSRCTVLDPMMGSGTTLAIARLLGHRAIGYDIDPLAVLLATAWCTDLDPAKLRKAARGVAARATTYARELRGAEAYPPGADAATRRYVRYWFDAASRRELAALAQAIRGVRHRSTRAQLWCAFSRLIITKDAGASLARDVSHSRPHKAFARSPRRPLDNFAASVARVIGRSPFADGRRRPIARAAAGDARALSLRARSVDLVITSPPYLNALDYMRGHRLALVWMGYGLKPLRDIRSRSAGTEAGISEAEFPAALEGVLRALRVSSLDPRHKGMLRRYIVDVDAIAAEVTRVLKDDGRAVFVVGDSMLGGMPIRNSMAVTKVAEARGLKLTRRRLRTLPENRRYLPPPSAGRHSSSLDKRMRREVVLEFARST
jgi:hypothetical protein